LAAYNGGAGITGGMVQGLMVATWGLQANVTGADKVDNGWQINGTVSKSGNALVDYIISDELVAGIFKGVEGEEKSSMEEKVSATASLTLDAKNITMDGAEFLSKASVAGRGMKVFIKTTGLVGAAVGGLQSGYNIIQSIRHGTGVKWNDVTGLLLGIASGVALLTPIGETYEGLSLALDAATLVNDTYSATELH
jgi:hypothetical protein